MKSWIFIGLLIAMMGGAAYYYYSSTQSRIAQLIENNAVLDENNKQLVTANQTNLNTITELQQSYQRVREQYTQIQSEFRVIRLQNEELRERLGRHELDALAAAKPGLVEDIINDASEDALRCFELLSGSPLTKQERDAKTAVQANSECPWFFDEMKQ
jgi:regulator of replication initiation timing